MTKRLPPSDDPEIEKKREKWRKKRAEFAAKNPSYYRDRMREQYRKNPEDMRRRKREAHHKNPMISRRTTLKKLYGITPEDYDRMLAAQNFGCGICGTRDIASKNAKYGHIDHDHSKKIGDDGFVRGILCTECNLGGGRYKDDPALLRKAADWYANLRGKGVSISGLKVEAWSSNQNHEERHFFMPANKMGYQSSHYILGYNPQVISEEKIQRIMAIVAEDNPSAQ